jgi:hypothetical protein
MMRHGWFKNVGLPQLPRKTPRQQQTQEKGELFPDALAVSPATPMKRRAGLSPIVFISIFQTEIQRDGYFERAPIVSTAVSGSSEKKGMMAFKR